MTETNKTEPTMTETNMTETNTTDTKMTGAAPSHPLKPEFQAWFDAWKASIERVLSQVSGQPHIFEVVHEPLAANDSDLRYTVTAAGTFQGEMALRLSPLSALRLTRKFIGEPEPPSAAESASETVTDETREALEELLRQIAGLAATSAGASAGGQVQLALARADAPWAWTSDAVATLRTRDEIGTEIAVEIRISPALAAALTARVSAAAAAASAPQSPVTDGLSEGPASSAPQAVSAAVTPEPRSAAASSSATPPQSESAANYGRLLEVGLGVKLRFGMRRMLLRDVLALSAGLVVELDNKLNSPVDLLLDGRVIARGDVVVIDGKYGLRVTEVVDNSPLGAQM